MDMSTEEYLKNLQDLVHARTEQLRSCAELNSELVQALRTVRSHLGPKELAILNKVDKDDRQRTPS
jgi:hypothetical protein